MYAHGHDMFREHQFSLDGLFLKILYDLPLSIDAWHFYLNLVQRAFYVDIFTFVIKS